MSIWQLLSHHLESNQGPGGKGPPGPQTEMLIPDAGQATPLFPQQSAATPHRPRHADGHTDSDSLPQRLSQTSPAVTTAGGATQGPQTDSDSYN